MSITPYVALQIFILLVYLDAMTEFFQQISSSDGIIQRESLYKILDPKPRALSWAIAYIYIDTLQVYYHH